MRVGEFMVPKDKLVIASSETTIADAGQQMVEKSVSATIIVDNGAPVGIITKTDVIRGLLVDSFPASDPVSKIMATNLVTIEPNTPRDVAAEEIMKKKVHHLVVVENGSVVGIISAWDIAREVTLDGKAWPYNREGLKSAFK